MVVIYKRANSTLRSHHLQQRKNTSTKFTLGGGTPLVAESKILEEELRRSVLQLMACISSESPLEKAEAATTTLVSMFFL